MLLNVAYLDTVVRIGIVTPVCNDRRQFAGDNRANLTSDDNDENKRSKTLIICNNLSSYRIVLRYDRDIFIITGREKVRTRARAYPQIRRYARRKTRVTSGRDGSNGSLCARESVWFFFPARARCVTGRAPLLRCVNCKFGTYLASLRNAFRFSSTRERERETERTRGKTRGIARWKRELPAMVLAGLFLPFRSSSRPSPRRRRPLPLLVRVRAQMRARMQGVVAPRGLPLAVADPAADPPLLYYWFSLSLVPLYISQGKNVPALVRLISRFSCPRSGPIEG